MVLSLYLLLTTAVVGVGLLARVSTHGIPGGLVTLGLISAYAALIRWPGAGGRGDELTWSLTQGSVHDRRAEHTGRPCTCELVVEEGSAPRLSPSAARQGPRRAPRHTARAVDVNCPRPPPLSPLRLRRPKRARLHAGGSGACRRR